MIYRTCQSQLEMSDDHGQTHLVAYASWITCFVLFLKSLLEAKGPTVDIAKITEAVVSSRSPESPTLSEPFWVIGVRLVFGAGFGSMFRMVYSSLPRATFMIRFSPIHQAITCLFTFDMLRSSSGLNSNFYNIASSTVDTITINHKYNK